ncbi:hypothetical protein P9112_011903 [Eukaryota sp. TZLM1-RC]
MEQLSNSIEIIKDRLYFFVQRKKVLSLDVLISAASNECHFFTTDTTRIYEPFVYDFGPLHLGHTIEFCRDMNALLSDPQHKSQKLYYCTACDQNKRENAVYLMAAYSLLCLGRTPEESFNPFTLLRPALIPFRDASAGLSTFNLTVLDCLRGLLKAKELELIDLDSFDTESYEFYSRVENGDMNWIIPGKILAFAGPSEQQNLGYSTLTPRHYIPYFKKHNITEVVRLNKKCYPATRFTSEGINHHTLYFVDGGLPENALLKKFLNIVDNAEGAVAVHCKAGLGRTGTLIGCWMMQHYFMTAIEVIGYLRIARPGSVIAQQQNFLCEMERKLHKFGRNKQSQSQSPLVSHSPVANCQNLAITNDVSAASPLSRSTLKPPNASILDTPPRSTMKSEARAHRRPVGGQESSLSKRFSRLSL